jgi:chromosome segregation ATPase
MASPLSVRVSEEVKEEFKRLSEQIGGTQDDFVATLLTAFKERQTETDTGSPVYRERAKVAEALSQIERVVVGFLEIAHNEKDNAISKAQDQVEQIQSELAELKEALKECKLESNETSQAKTALEEKLSSLVEQAKSLKALQDAWTEKETALNSRIADLDTEAKEARQLKTELTEAATEIINQKNKVALAEQKSVADEKNLTEIKSRLQEKNKTLEQLRDDLQQAKDTANQRVVTLTQEHAEEKGRLTAQLEMRTQKIIELESMIADLKGQKS